MCFVVKKKNIVRISVIVLMIISCVISFIDFDNKTETLNLVENTDNTNADLLPGEAIAVSAQENHFEKIRSDREIVRSKTTELLENIIDNNDSSEDAKKRAEEKIIEMANDMNNEKKIESLLMAKGFDDCIVFISDKVVNVTIKGKNLEKDDMAKINDIIFEITGNNNIKIVEVE